MRDELFAHYERELSFFRRQAAKFAHDHPAMAGALLLRESVSHDPHVERLIEAFALIAGRIQQRLDDDYPELTEGLLNVLYPHYLAPLPSLAVVEMVLDPKRAQLPDGLTVARKSMLRSNPVNGQACRYQTCFPVRLWPVDVQGVRFMHPPFPFEPPPGTRSMLRIELGSLGGMNFTKTRVDRLRFFLAGPLSTAVRLYELIFNRTFKVWLGPVEGGVRPRPPQVHEPSQCLAPVGFEADEGLLPYPDRSFPGYRLLTELFAFPVKFLFFDLIVPKDLGALVGESNLEVTLFFNAEAPGHERYVDRKTLRLGCTPAVNLFEQTAEPITLDHTRYEYRVTPDVTRPVGMEVYRIESVQSANPRTGALTTYHPFYALAPDQGGEPPRAFWYATRRPSERPGDEGSDVYLTVVDRDFDPTEPADPALIVKALCTNRDLPSGLSQTAHGPTFQPEAVVPLSHVECLVGPTATHRPPMGRTTQWRLISHLALNYLSLVDETEGVESLRQLLRLYQIFRPAKEPVYRTAFDLPQAGALVPEEIVDAITAVRSRRGVTFLPSEEPGSLCRGLDVTLEFRADADPAAVFLVGSVLERFFALYASINSYTRLTLTKQGVSACLKQWPPRAGTRVIL
jgi:type VI secretion system protein ImpG